MLRQNHSAEIIHYWASLASDPSLFEKTAVDKSELICRWEKLGRRISELASQPSWKPCEILTKASLRYASAMAIDVSDLVSKSNLLLYPLEDPLTLEFGRHRWLAGDREEAYSDWLKWVFENLGSAELVGNLLYGDAIPSAILASNGHCVCEREKWVPEGHAGQSGRLDLVLHLGSETLLVIEVKLEGADSADTAKQSGYHNWLYSQNAQFKGAILLAIDGNAGEYDKFKLLLWKDFCQRLRRLLPEIVASKGIITAALSAGFISAVEQNILRLPSLRNLSHPSNAMLNLSRLDEVANYLAEYLKH